MPPKKDCRISDRRAANYAAKATLMRLLNVPNPSSSAQSASSSSPQCQSTHSAEFGNVQSPKCDSENVADSDCEEKFFIANFAIDNSVEIVAANWIAEKGTKCWWPLIKSAAQRRKYILRGTPPDPNTEEWSLLKCRKLRHGEGYETIEKAVKGLNRSEEESDWLTTAEEEELTSDSRKSRNSKRDPDDEYHPESRAKNKKMRTKGLIVNRLAQPPSIKVKMPLSQKSAKKLEVTLGKPQEDKNSPGSHLSNKSQERELLQKDSPKKAGQSESEDIHDVDTLALTSPMSKSGDRSVNVPSPTSSVESNAKDLTKTDEPDYSSRRTSTPVYTGPHSSVRASPRTTSCIVSPLRTGGCSKSTEQLGGRTSADRRTSSYVRSISFESGEREDTSSANGGDTDSASFSPPVQGQVVIESGLRETLQKLFANQNMIISRLEKLDSKVSTLMIDLSHTSLPEGWPSVMPLVTTSAYLKFEDFLRRSSSNFDYAVKFFKKIGGKDEKKMCRQCLSKLFGPQLRVQLNWDGSELKMGIKTHKTPEVIIEACHDVFSSGNATRSVLGPVISKWLRQTVKKSPS